MIWLLVGLTGAVVALDLITKFTIPGILNPGISWGLGAQWPWLWLVVVIFSGVVVVGCVVWFALARRRTWWLTVGLALFMGGVLGNAIDRLLTGGAVHDFIDFVIFKNNLADMFLIAGAIMAGVHVATR